MALLILVGEGDPLSYAEPLRRLAPERDIRVWPEAGDKRDIRYALAWQAPPGILPALPALKVMFSTGAGVDHLLADPELPDVPLVRFVDSNLTLRMREYVVLNVLLHQRRQLDYAELQRKREWKELPLPSADEVRVGVMGLGVLGTDCAQALARLGFKVAGWSRSRKAIPGIECYAADDLDAFLARTDILVCLLPATPETRGLLDRRLFAKLARDGALPGPVLINAGRGALQVDADIVAALDAGGLSACSLDVFETEPLPASSPLWSHTRAVVTPHIASISDRRSLARYVLHQIARYESGEPLQNLVDRRRGY